MSHPLQTTRTNGIGRAITQALLGCALLYGVVYVIANDVIAVSLQERYSRLDQAVSELSAIESPSAGFLRAMLPIFSVLMFGFAVGVWRAARDSFSLRVTGVILFFGVVTGVAWLWFPMTARVNMGAGAMPTNDVGHLVLSGMTVLLILLRMGFGAAALGMRFRVFTAVCAATLLGFGAWMAALAPGAAVGTTPWMGLAERIMLGAWLTWDSVFAVALIRRQSTLAPPWSASSRAWK